MGRMLSGACLFVQDNVPGFSGALAWLNTSHAGVTNLQPIIPPPLGAPLGDRSLLESRALGAQGLHARENGATGPYQGHFAATLEYQSVDYIANPHLPLAAGRLAILSRCKPSGSRNLQDPPIVYLRGARASRNGECKLRRICLQATDNAGPAGWTRGRRTSRELRRSGTPN
jgi:hypothetical protein